MKKLLLLFSVIFLFISCSSENEITENHKMGKATFSFSELDREITSTTAAKSLTNLDPYAVLVTITDANNNIVINNEQLILLGFGSEYITDSIELAVGDYEVTAFNIINTENEIIYASPLEGSEFAAFVITPLPISFAVTSNETSTVVPDVILVLETDSSEQFGFASFSFDVIETQKLYISAKKIENEIESDVEATFTLTIQNSDYTLTGDLEIGSNSLILPKITDDTEIHITISHDWETQNITLTGIQASEYLESTPLIFYFSPKRINVIPVPTLTYSSNSDYSIQTFVNTTPYTNSVEWTLPEGATLVGGTLTDETIDVRFSNSGDFNINLKIFSEGFDLDGNPNILESESINETITVPIITSLSGIPDPVIIGGDFERPADEFLSVEGLARTNSDLGKEYWIADGLSTRVLIPGTTEAFPAYPGETSDNDRTWFETGLFNRIFISSLGRTGWAAKWQASQSDPRIVVQYIEIVPGVDYKVSFWYSNDVNSADTSLVGLILDTSVVKELDISSETIIAQGAYNEGGGNYTEGELSFTVNNSDAEAIKLYFNTSSVIGDYRLDDISIAID